MALYVSVAEIRAAGLPESTADDATVTALLTLWQEFIDRACRQWFESRAATVELDGTDSDTLHLPVPIITLTSLRLNNSADVLDATLYKVYANRTDWPDDRRNPRIKLTGPEFTGDIFSRPSVGTGQNRFRKGRQNQELVGTFGFTEADGSTPALIKHALTKLVIEKAHTPLVPNPANPVPPPVIPTGLMTEETTDDHKRKYAAPGGGLKARPGGLAGITNDPEILRILSLYKAPLAIATPAHWSTD